MNRMTTTPNGSLAWVSRLRRRRSAARMIDHQADIIGRRPGDSRIDWVTIDRIV